MYKKKKKKKKKIYINLKKKKKKPSILKNQHHPLELHVKITVYQWRKKYNLKNIDRNILKIITLNRSDIVEIC